MNYLQILISSKEKNSTFEHEIIVHVNQNLDDTIEFLKTALTESAFPRYQHLNSNIQISLVGDSATGRVMCFNPMEVQRTDDESEVFFLGLWYIDDYVRTKKGWRINKRIEKGSWAFNVPDFLSLSVK